MSQPKPCGWLLLDKPVGISSAQAVARVKRLFQASRAGHAGTLDPLASGLLAIALGAATRWSGWLLDAPKSYRFTIRLGQVTASHDAESPVETTADAGEIPEMTHEEIAACLASFTGTISQTPPMHSAVHIEGRRLYELAREGKEVERPAREVHVERLGLVEARPDEWDLEVACGKGTYVRVLGHDIGQALGCGAYVSRLRRVGMGPFDEAQAVELDRLEAETEAARLDHMMEADAVLPDWPSHVCTAEEEKALRNGQRVRHEGVQGFWKLRGVAGDFLGVAEAVGGEMLQPRRLMGWD